jgi:hypothetical protein
MTVHESYGYKNEIIRGILSGGIPYVPRHWQDPEEKSYPVMKRNVVRSRDAAIGIFPVLRATGKDFRPA